MEAVINNDPDLVNDPDAQRRLRGIMRCFETPLENYELMKKIYKLSPIFISFCYKALGTKPNFKIRRHVSGFTGTPHTSWEDFQDKLDDRQFLKDMIFETAFRMLQQVVNLDQENNSYNYIKHVNTALARYRVCEILWSDDINRSTFNELVQAKDFFIWYIQIYNGIDVYYELYDYCFNRDAILTAIYFYHATYALKYDYVSETDALDAYNKLESINMVSSLIEQKTLDKLLYDIHTKYKFVGRSK